MEQYPIGFWNYVNAGRQGGEAVKDWADCGMTVAMGPAYNPEEPGARENMHAILQEAERKKISVIHCHQDTDWRALQKYGKDEFRRRAEDIIKEFGRYTSLFGFHVGDEPDLFMKEDYPAVVEAFQILNSLAPGLRHFSNFLPWWQGIEQQIYCPEQTYEEHLANYVRECGIRQLCYDCYAQMKPDQKGWENFFHNLLVYHDVARQMRVPCWTTLLSAGHFDYKAPNEHEFRWQLHAAAAHGMKGALWFFFYMREPHDNYHGAPIDEHWERSSTYEWLSRINRTFNKSLGPTLMTLKHTGTWHVGRSFGGWPSFDRKDAYVQVILAETPFIYSRFTDADGRPYIALMNNSQNLPTYALVRLHAHVEELKRVGWEGKLETAGIEHRYTEFSEFGKWFAPGQLELYQVILKN